MLTRFAAFTTMVRKIYTPVFKYLAVLLSFFLLPAMGMAQTTTGLSIGAGANFSVFGSDTLAISTNLFHSGTFVTAPNATINFMGLAWSNDPSAVFSENGGVGGKFRFLNLGAVTGSAQLLGGGYNAPAQTGSGFPNISLENPNGLFLINTDLLVKNTLDLNGTNFLWLNGYNLQSGVNGIGSGTTTNGIIKNYSQYAYIVTGTTTNGGYLYRTNVGSSIVTFPIGADGTQATYLPMGMLYQGTPQRFNGRVFNQILIHATTGGNESSRYVKATWNIGKDTKEVALTQLVLQHSSASLEGPFYTAVRNTNPPGIIPGYLTTGTPDPNSYISIFNLNAALSPTNSFFSKSVDTLAKTPQVNQYDTIAQLWRPNTVPIKPKASLSKAVGDKNYRVNGTYDVSYKIVVRNDGNAPLTSLTIADNLATAFPSPLQFTITSVTAINGLLHINNNYNGSSDTVLVSKDTLGYKQTDTILLKLNIVPNGSYGTFYNLATSIADSAGGIFVRSGSTPGLNPDSSLTAVPAKTPLPLIKIPVKVPGGFSPNNDGINDKFVIAYATDYNVGLEVYNRWGSLVFKNQNYANEWDGRSNQPGVYNNNTKLPEGTYFIIVTLTEKTTGIVTTVSGAITMRYN